MILSINFLPFSRDFLMLNTLKEMTKLEGEFKSLFEVVIHSGPGINNSEHTLVCNKGGIKVRVINYNTHEYMQKIHTAASSSCKYSMKIDEDIFISHHTLRYMLQNLSVLDSDNILAITPALSTGIPTVEMFIEDVFNDEEKNTIYDMFCKTHIPNIWGVDYSSLNSNYSKWDAEDYYRKVAAIPHHFKGIHPLRVSSPIQNEMFKIIRGKKNKIMDKQDYCMEIKKIPYFCNSVFTIKTQEWKQIISNYSLYRDLYDEVPFNLYKDMHSKSLAFIRNANTIHPSYNTISDYMQLAVNYNNLISGWL